MSRFIDNAFLASARSRSGRIYRGSRISTATHVLDIPAELAALVRAVHHNDFDITEIVTTLDEEYPVSPLVLKILADHTSRTGVPIRYILRTIAGQTISEINDVREALP